MTPTMTPEELRALMRADFTFSDQQFAAITAPLAPGVVVAGAGSGKTTVMAARVVWLVATGQVRPEQVLGLTFTTKATAQLAAGIRGALRDSGLMPPREQGQDEVVEPAVATYHSYAQSLLVEHGLRIGYEPDSRLLADASRYQLATRAMHRYRAPVRHLTESPDHVVRYLLALDAEMTEHLVDPDDVRRVDAHHRPLLVAELERESRKTYRELNEKAIRAIDARGELLGLVEAYRRLKADLGLVDFSDQIALSARLARDHADVGRLEREKYAVVLLDEYQDTSVAQAVMLSRLFSGDDPGHGRGHPVTAVGDPHQAIYGWRGASVSNILQFDRSFGSVEGRTPVYPLNVNRRSDVRVLATANHLAAPLYAASDDVRPLQPKPGAEPGEIRAAVHETWDAELAALGDQVLAAHGTGTAWREIGVLTRDNAHAAAVFDALSAREVPVEIVGLKGLLRLPEVAEIVATLSLVQDVTDNAALLTLLNGPRWAIGLRDLALLGRRARELAGPAVRDRAFSDVHAELAAAVEGSDPAELAALGDALDDPGEGPYSPQALERFAALAAELRRLRAAVGEPILDLVRRIVDVCGIDVELAASVSPAATARRENLDLFVQAVAEFQAVDGPVTLTALLAWLEAEDEFGQGLDVATPSEADSVKLLTVHRAKGLEWDAVFLVGVTETKFPTNRGRSRWTTVASVMPVELRGDAEDLPQLGGHSPADLKAYAEAAKEHDGVEELRLGYVAWTRARHLLSVSCWQWKPSGRTGLGPSPYLVRTREAMAQWGATPTSWAEKPEKSTPSPYAVDGEERPFPLSHHTAEVERRREAARWVQHAEEQEEEAFEDVLVLEQVSAWDATIDRLLAEAEQAAVDAVEVPLPGSLSATALSRLRADPEAFAADLARPMPRQPSPAARFGTRFHAWVEARFDQQGMFDPEELPGQGDAGIDGEDDLAELVARFESGAFADRTPYAVEAPFALVLRHGGGPGQVVRGRIDAVYTDGDGFLLVDWKTNRQADADPLQLAVYRQAWAELHGVEPERVRAAFYYVRDDRLVEPDLVDRAALEELLSP
ncbi:ATP-dependent helicase [Nocardioides mangrovicus]|uniref:DNA 3'-5' helicase n=2 Tax=Nocardioides mangrovicus TaxID=2478913 RepID=A0A3L8P8B1_9ACTN|nr:ATP-dependent helicase [Nocardioides mangrovicus]